MCEIPSPGFSHGICRHFARSQLTSARFCQQTCEILSPCFHTAFTRILLAHSSLPARFCQHMCEIPSPCFHAVIYRHFARSQLTSARFGQQICEIPSPGFHSVFTGILLVHSSLPPDFANTCVKSVALVFTRYLQAFCSITAHFRQILPADL